MNATRRDSAVGIVLIVLLAAYILPVFLVALMSWFGSLDGSTGIGRFFIAMLASPYDFGSMVQKFLVPLTAGISAALLWSDKTVWRTYTLLGLSVLGILLAAYLIFYLGIPENAQDLWQLSGNQRIAVAETFDDLNNQYLTGMIATLLTYAALLFGFKLGPQKGN